MSISEKEGHLERTAHEPREKELLLVTLSRIEQVNDRIRLLRLELQSGPVKFLAGQWLDTFVPGVSKAGGFTITSAPSAAAPASSAAAPPAYLELAVQESPDNAPAVWLWGSPGDILGSTLQVRVGGSFVFPPSGRAAEGVARLVFVAGGVGVNPLVSMLGSLAGSSELRRGIEVLFMYATKMPSSQSLNDILFLKRICGWFGKTEPEVEGKVRGQVQLYITGEHEPIPEGAREISNTEIDIYTRRLSADELVEVVQDGQADRGSSLVYICGPPGMTDEFTEALTQAGVDEEMIMTEKWW